jgi:hypothetical protein
MRKHVLAGLIASGALLLVAAPLAFAAPASTAQPTTAVQPTTLTQPTSPTGPTTLTQRTTPARPANHSKIEGQPTIDETSPTGYYLWRDDGFHLRTHGPRAEHDFDAVLRTKGYFENVDPVRLEKDDRVELRDGGHELVIHFHTYDFTDGVNFTIRDGERLHLNLKLDDKPAQTDQIFLGARGRHPKHNPFGIRL